MRVLLSVNEESDKGPDYTRSQHELFTLYHVTEVLIMVIAPSGVGFVNYEYDHRQNWTSMTRTPSYKCSNRDGDNHSRLIVVL